MATLTDGSLRAVTAVIYSQLVMSANQRQDSCSEPQQTQYLTRGALQISFQPDWQMDDGVFGLANDGSFSNPEV